MEFLVIQKENVKNKPRFDPIKRYSSIIFQLKSKDVSAFLLIKNILIKHLNSIFNVIYYLFFQRAI